MALLDGRGLSTQLADLASFFLTLGGCILAGLITGNRLWFYPAVSLLGVAAFGRVLAWLCARGLRPMASQTRGLDRRPDSPPVET